MAGATQRVESLVVGEQEQDVGTAVGAVGGFRRGGHARDARQGDAKEQGLIKAPREESSNGHDSMTVEVADPHRPRRPGTGAIHGVSPIANSF